MPKVDLAFELTGSSPIPSDHGYRLYSAVSRLLPVMHAQNGVAIHPIRGQQIGNRMISLRPDSRLVVRASDSQIPQLIALAGKQIGMGRTTLRAGVPQVRALTPAPALRSRLVVIKVSDVPNAADLDKDNFGQAVRRQLDALGLSSETILTIGKRRTLRIKDKEVVGYEVILEGLTAEESLDVQEKGIGGRRHMGCGVFVALR